jgi:spermidine synthase
VFEILDHCETPLGVLCLRRRELLGHRGAVVTEVTLNHEFLMSSYNTDSERALAEHALALHEGSELRCLIGGLGLGYTAHELLQSPRVAHVDVVELLPQVVGWLEKGLLPLSEELAADSRLHVVPGDVYGQLAGPPSQPWDLILIDVDHNPDESLHPQNQAFYSVEGLESASAHLAPGGVLAVWSSEDSGTFLARLEQVFPTARRQPVSWYNELIEEDQEDVLFLAQKLG